jgi:hypothetical protein
MMKVGVWDGQGTKHVEQIGEKRNSYILLEANLEGKRPLGRSRRRLVDNIKRDLGHTGWDCVD